MKKQTFVLGAVIVIILEIIALVIFSQVTPDFKQDTVSVNSILNSVTWDFYNIDRHENQTNLNYVVLNADNEVIFKTADGLSGSVNRAISNRDTLLDVVIEEKTVGKIIIHNDSVEKMVVQKRKTVTFIVILMAVECVICVAFAAYEYLSVIKPFKRLKEFAQRVATGNLDLPLNMDKNNLFGAFTESFDIMRSELKKARLAEAQANRSKKELVAKLSHDIKTPVASIKAVSEVGIAVTESEKDRYNYKRIIEKADRINALIQNLFTATLEELAELSVTPTDLDSVKIAGMLEDADYLSRADIPQIPECRVFADKLRLQQVFDNIFSNSYKYADTKITVSAIISQTFLEIYIEDYGEGVKEEELSVIKEKFRRGSNAENTEGAGLGLYISDFFMVKMNGELITENGENGFKVTLKLPLVDKI